MSGAEKNKQPRLKRFITGLALAWTIVVTTGLSWNVAHENANTAELALIQAAVAYEKDVIYRRWNTMHGGVYAPVSEHTRPNPYMSNMPGRDITTSSNRKMTLINPDYMMRQIDELTERGSGILGHVTSLDPARPENAPDPWEAEALKALQQGETEVSKVQIMNGRKYMRLIRPVYTEEGCVQCHEEQSHRPGDIQGGLSVAVPMEALEGIEFSHIIEHSLTLIFIWLICLAGIMLFGKKLIKNDRERKLIEERLTAQNTELQKTHLELDTLYKVSSATGQTIDLSILLDIILETITGLDLLNVERKGGIFIIEGSKLNLVSHLGHSEEFLDWHNNLNVGDCLCGLAAKTGEVIISGNCEDDIRHTFKIANGEPHGHVIIPLKVLNKVTGVLYLYLPANTTIGDDKLDMLQAIGNQIGIAIENARLFEETKALTLHDPLTGLANRRFMDIVLKRNLARAKRLKGPISVIMADIDHFKDYNDMYGHYKGDDILVQVAKILLRETREIDLAVRYGGEEFLILLSEIELSTASRIAERIRKIVEADTDVTISLGVTSYSHGSKEEDIVAKADTAMYQAKQKGRNRVEAID